MMKPFRRTLVFTIMATGLITIPAAAQSSFEVAAVPGSDWQGQIDKATAQMDRVWPALEQLQIKIPAMAFLPQDAADRARDAQDRARDAQDRARDAQERVRDAAERVRDREDRNTE